MNLIPRLHGFLFQVEKHLGKARLLLRQREHGFVHHLQSQRRLDAFAMRIGHAKLDARIFARLVNRRVQRRFDLELVGRLHECHAMMRPPDRVPPEKIRGRSRWSGQSPA